MLDFTSSLYLGLRHPAGSGRQWPALTLGKPAALQAAPGAEAVAAELAALQGCEAATLLPSTLHLFWDLFDQFGQRGTVICVEAGTYAIASWGVQRAAAMGAAVHVFAAGDVCALERLMAATARGRRHLLVVCDGLRPGHDRQSPLAVFALLAARHGGCLVLDDTQALGVVGAGGGGSMRRHGLIGAPVLVGASLSKGFGVPLAVLAGSRCALQRFEAASQTRMHTSPPSAASIEAARHALAVNRRCGDRLRALLLQRVRQFRGRLSTLRLRCSGGDFPVQQLLPLPGIDMTALHAALLARRVRSVLHASGALGPARLSFIFTAALTAACVEQAVQALAQAVSALRQFAHPQLAEVS
jgi:8-amino-7-oxononanoate synthase